MDLSIATYGGAVTSDGDMDSKLKESGTFAQMIEVTNNSSSEMATGVMVRTDLQAGLDVWEPDQSQTEYGTTWVNSQGAKDKARFVGDPAMVDSTNGTVMVNDMPMAGMDLKEMDLEDHPKGELIWELGTPLAPGETATMVFYSQLSPIKASGTDVVQTASIMAVDQGDTNPFNNQDFVEFKFGTPIVLDLNSDGVQTLSVDEGVEFDILGTGANVQTGWVSGEDALLAVDNNGNGQIDSRSELFGGEIGEGFAKLKTFDSNDDGFVNALDADFGELQVWQDANENGITDDGELVALDSAGIASLNTAYTDVFGIDSQGNIHGEHSSATLADGSTIEMVDVYFQVNS